MTSLKRKQLLFTMIFIGAFCLIAHMMAGQEKKHSKVAVSLIALIARPEAYQGKRVRVWGYVEIQKENSILYLSVEDYRVKLTKNGLFLRLTEAVYFNRKKYDKHYVLLEGTFNVDEGNLGLCSGSLDNVDRMMVWKGKFE